jgi:hypothetical protein
MSNLTPIGNRPTVRIPAVWRPGWRRRGESRSGFPRPQEAAFRETGQESQLASRCGAGIGRQLTEVAKIQGPKRRRQVRLLALLDFDQGRLRHPGTVLPRMDLAPLQENSPQVGDTSLRERHLVVGLNHGSSDSAVPRFRKLPEYKCPDMPVGPRVLSPLPRAVSHAEGPLENGQPVPAMLIDAPRSRVLEIALLRRRLRNPTDEFVK